MNLVPSPGHVTSSKLMTVQSLNFLFYKMDSMIPAMESGEVFGMVSPSLSSTSEGQAHLLWKLMHRTQPPRHPSLAPAPVAVVKGTGLVG